MARRLIEHGHSLVIYDRDEQALAELSAIGAQMRAARAKWPIARTRLHEPATPLSLRSRIGCARIGVRQVDQDPGRPVHVGSRTEQEVAAGLLEKGIETVDAPSAAARPVRKKVRSPSWPGQAGAIAQVRELFDIFGKVFIVGEKAGQAQLLKLLNNMLSSTAFAITSEAFVAGVKGGLDPEVMMSVFNAGSGKNGATSTNSRIRCCRARLISASRSAAYVRTSDSPWKSARRSACRCG